MDGCIDISKLVKIYALSNFRKGINVSRILEKVKSVLSCETGDGKEKIDLHVKGQVSLHVWTNRSTFVLDMC